MSYNNYYIELGKKDKKGTDGRSIPNAFGHHMPVPSAGMFAWRVQKDGSIEKYQEDKIAAGTYVIQNDEETPIATDVNTRKKQLNAMNEAEGLAPIAAKGGTEDATGIYTEVSCGNISIPQKYSCISFAPFTGGYSLQRATANTTDIPKFVTSLPHEKTDLGKVHLDTPPTAHMGDKTVELDDSLSFPPATILLPLFKI